ncbi:MAG: MFS transporter [Novosphingobium sp.]|nr:MFS transporter [Novosphingobium sp.]MCP5401257.1 MFS transporter [Novosphingobium sp.]
MSAAQEWKSGWKLVFASFVGFLFYSAMFASMSIFIGPISAEFGWSRTVVSAGLSLSSIITAVLSPFFGVLIDRYGTRKLALPGLVVACFAISAFGLATASSALWLAMWAVYAIVSLSVKATIWTAAVAGVFEKARGLALAITLAGATAAHAIMPVTANFLVDAFGWRLSFAWIGFGLGSIAWILSYFFLYDVHDRNAAKSPGEDGGKGNRPDLPGLSLSEAWRNFALWRIGISILVIMALTIGLVVHQIEILVGVGVTRNNAAWLASLAGAVGIAGKIITGILLDRFRGNWVGGITMTSAALAFAILLGGAQTTPLLILAMLVNGYTAGAKLHIASYLTVQYSGMKNFGTIYGVMTSMVALGSGLGPVVAGAIYDLSGNYDTFLLAGTIGLVLSGALLFTLPRYPDWSAADKARPATA